jgi:hypothetical protein
MSTCPYYKPREKRIQRNPISESRIKMPDEILKIPWCEHGKTPVDRDDAHTIGGASLLKCYGGLKKCQIPDVHQTSSK